MCSISLDSKHAKRTTDLWKDPPRATTGIVRRPLSVVFDVMSRRHKLRAQRQRMIKQKLPAYLFITDQTRIWRPAFSIAFEKVFHNRIAKDILCIHHIKGNIQ